MVWIYTDHAPEAVEVQNHLGLKRRTVNYDAEAVEPTEEQPYSCRYKRVQLDAGVWNYDAIVNAIITAEYPTDKMQAVVNNYLANPTDSATLAEFEQMQALRRHAKDIAKAVLE
jgi:hypothetical protein